MPASPPLTSRCCAREAGGSPEGPKADPEEGVSRIEQIKAAIQRGEEKAALRASGEEEEEEPRQLTLDEERALSALMAAPDEVSASDLDDSAFEEELASAGREYRINRTLEFCPDGVLAREILREMCLNGTAPGARAWNAVIDAFGRREALDDALAVFTEMREAGVAADEATYDLLALPAMRRGEFRFVERLYSAKAPTRGGSLGAESLEILLHAYANGRPPQEDRAAAAFRSEMDVAQELGLPAAAAATAAVLRALRRAAGLNRTCELCWEYGVDPAGAL